MLNELIKKEGWKLEVRGNTEVIIACGKEFPKTHPAIIHLKLYREETNPELKYGHMKAAHDYIWPKAVWHYWTEQRFRAHCEGWNYISMAAGASAAKSYDMAKIALLFWFANPKERGVIVASTTLESLTARIWGYITVLINDMAIKLPFQYLGGNSPKILFPKKKGESEIRDTIHGMFAVSARQGSDETVISSWIGRHPKDALMVVLDEATDMPGALTKSLANLDSSEKPFQLWAIGNSNSRFDLHGMISTPEDGWESIDPMKMVRWRTTQKNGICLFFSCYNSPAIYEQDPEVRKKLSRFLITKEQIDEKEKYYGKDSDSFWRFVLGYWKTSSTDSTVVSKEFLAAYKVSEKVEWSGFYPIAKVAGLDAAFSTGGDSCILRVAKIGVRVDGKVCLDYMGDKLLFKINISATSPDSAEIQIAKQVCVILISEGIKIEDLCTDATGQGRAIAGVIQLQMKSMVSPLKVYTIKQGNKSVNSFDCIVMTPLDMWTAFRDFMLRDQIKGLDFEAVHQLATRLIIKKTQDSPEKLEAKKDYKNRMMGINPSLGHSPDQADAAALALLVAQRNYGFRPGQTREIQQPMEFHHQKLYNHMMNIKMIEEDNQRKFPKAGFKSSGVSMGFKRVV